MPHPAVGAALLAIALTASTLTSPSAAHTAPGPYHPDILWVDSAETAGESAPNGRAAALVDEDTGRSPAEVTYWTTQWQGGGPDFPHAIVMRTKGSLPVCGIQFTARPNHTTNGEVTGAAHAPGALAVFAFDTAPTKPAESEMDTWRAQVRTGKFGQGTRIATGGLAAVNTPQLIALPATTQPVIALVGLAAVDPTKREMAAADIKLVPCSDTEPGHGDGVDGLVRDLHIDQLPFGEPGQVRWFDPAVHTYTATAYRHTSTVSLRIRTVDGARVTIDGQGPDAQGRVRVNLLEGLNVVTATVHKGAEQARYVVNIRKTNTDFRGNVHIPATVVINGAPAAEGAKLTDGSLATTWTSGKPVRANVWSADVTGFTLEFADSRQLARINAWGMPQFTATAQWWHPGSSVSIAVQANPGAPWLTVADRASLRRDAGGFFYWDLNGYHQAQRVRVWLNQVTGGEMPPGDVLASVRFAEVQAWGLPVGAPVPATPPRTEQVAFDPGSGKWGTNRAQTLALHHGILLPAWVPSESHGRGVFDHREQHLSGGAIPMFYDLPLFNSALMHKLGNTPWALAKAPAGGNSLRGNQQPYDFLTEQMRPYAPNLVDIQYGDEGEYSASEVEEFAKWFAFSKKTYPQALVHSNQNENPTWGNLKNMTTYVRSAQPDLLSWDTYYFGGGGVFGSHGPTSPSQMIPGLLNSNMWQVQRQVALEGLDGTGRSPILFGQYLDYSFDANFSESQKSIIPMLSLATGMKWLGLFRMEYNGYDFGSLFDHDGAPTRAFYEYARVFGDVKAMGRYLVGLHNRYVAIKAGDYDDRGATVPQGWHLGSFTAPQTEAINSEFGIRQITATNLGVINPGKSGDIVLGYFDKLPNLADEKTREIFGTLNPKAFMVVNGLVGTTSLPATGLSVRTDEGAYWQTRQQITLTLAKPAPHARLMAVNAASGAAEPVDLADAGNGTYTAQLTLGGGQGRLFYWTS